LEVCARANKMCTNSGSDTGSQGNESNVILHWIEVIILEKCDYVITNHIFSFDCKKSRNMMYKIREL